MLSMSANETAVPARLRLSTIISLNSRCKASLAYVYHQQFNGFAYLSAQLLRLVVRMMLPLKPPQDHDQRTG